MAVKLISLVMAVQAFMSTGAAAMSRMQTHYAGGEMAAVLNALESRGVVYKRTILMAAVQPASRGESGKA